MSKYVFFDFINNNQSKDLRRVFRFRVASAPNFSRAAFRRPTHITPPPHTHAHTHTQHTHAHPHPVRLVSCDNIPKYKAPPAPWRVTVGRRALRLRAQRAAAAQLRSHARGTLQIFRPTCVFYMPRTRRLCQMSNGCVRYIYVWIILEYTYILYAHAHVNVHMNLTILTRFQSFALIICISCIRVLHVVESVF